MNGATFFADVNYQGKSWTLNADASFVGADANDQFSSVRVPAGMTVTLFEHSDYGGRSLVLTADAPDLRSFGGPGAGGTWNDAASSVKISGGAAAKVTRLKKGSRFVECSFGGTVSQVDSKSDAGKVVVTRHDDKHYDATFAQANKVLSIQQDGALQSRPAGTYGSYEQLDAITAPDPNQVSLLYRVAEGVVLGGVVLQIVEE